VENLLERLLKRNYNTTKNRIRASQKGELGHITADAAATAGSFFWLLQPTSSEAGHTRGGR